MFVSQWVSLSWRHYVHSLQSKRRKQCMTKLDKLKKPHFFLPKFNLSKFQTTPCPNFDCPSHAWFWAQFGHSPELFKILFYSCLKLGLKQIWAVAIWTLSLNFFWRSFLNFFFSNEIFFSQTKFFFSNEIWRGRTVSNRDAPL